MLYCPFFMAQSTMALKVQVQAYRIGTCWRWCHDMHERPAFGQEVLEGNMSVTVCVVSMSRHSFEETFKVIYSLELSEREKQNRRHTKQLEATATLNDFRARSAAAMCSLLQQHDRQLRWLLWLVLGVLGLELHIPALNMHIFRTSEKDTNTCFCYYTSASCHGITFYYGLVLCSPPLSLFFKSSGSRRRLGQKWKAWSFEPAHLSVFKVASVLASNWFCEAASFLRTQLSLAVADLAKLRFIRKDRREDTLILQCAAKDQRVYIIHHYSISTISGSICCVLNAVACSLRRALLRIFWTADFFAKLNRFLFMSLILHCTPMPVPPLRLCCWSCHRVWSF